MEQILGEYSSRTDGARVWGLNFRLSTGVLDQAAPAMVALGIDVKEFFVLDGVEEELYPAHIARRLSMTRPTVAAHLRSLERKHLISRAIDSDDLRRHHLVLTDSGKTTVDDARRTITDLYDDRLSGLTEAERTNFTALLEKLTRS